MPPYTSRTQQPQRPQVFLEPRIVLAIDYGTTFTGMSSIHQEILTNVPPKGLAWMQTDSEREPQLSDLRLFRDWPRRKEPKVPSEVSYSLTSGDAGEGVFKQWGDSIDGRSKVLRWTKLELIKGRSPLEELKILRELIDGLPEVNRLHSDGTETTDVPRHLSKSADDIIEFYLRHIANQWHSWMVRQGRYVLEEVPVDIIVTHPAVCSTLPRGRLSVSSNFVQAMARPCAKQVGTGRMWSLPH
jgi:hypothetical protein